MNQVTTSVFDVAAYVLKKQGSMTHMKLQKLVYYCQAWSLVWDEAPMFSETIEAWANGPVVPPLFRQLKGCFQVDLANLTTAGEVSMTAQQRETADSVLEFYGTYGSQWLSDLTHMERPWKDAREGMKTGERGSKPITHAAMADYYSAFSTAQQRG